MNPSKDQTSQQAQLKQLDGLIQKGYQVMEVHYASRQACDHWLEAWEIVKQLATLAMRTSADFDQIYRRLSQSVEDWTYDVEMELHNAGIDHAPYHERRIQFVQEFFALFPDEMDKANRVVNFMRAEGEALWNLGRHEEADIVYERLIERLPDEGWGYIGWSDSYWLWRDSSTDYQKAEGILLRGLARPDLQDRTDVLERLHDLYLQWDKLEQAEAIGEQLDQLLKPKRSILAKQLRTMLSDKSSPSTADMKPATPIKKLGRNERCWCGSGKKYKHCHLKSDQIRGR
ncbi:SEC-C metal-binding domain-containing protein [Chloroflexota bacterium]